MSVVKILNVKKIRIKMAESQEKKREADNEFGDGNNAKRRKLSENILEKCMEKLPHIATIIFGYLDNKSLCQSQLVEKSWLTFINNHKLYWIRVTQNQPGWDLTIPKIDSKSTRTLGSHFLKIARKQKNVKCPPIFCAIALDNLELLKMLLEKLPSSMSMSYKWERQQGHFAGKIFSLLPVSYAAYHRHMKCFKYLLNHFESELNTENATPLHLAALQGNYEAVDLLMSLEKMDKTPKDPQGATPLHYAARGGSVDVIELLLKYECNKIDVEDNFNRTPFHDAAYSGYSNVVEFMMKNVTKKSPKSLAGYDALHEAASAGKLDCVKIMLSNGIDCYSKTSHSEDTALHLAVNNGHLEVISALLEHDLAISDQPNILGRTAFHEAVEKGKVECVKHLLSHGIDCNMKTTKYIKETPLHLAVRNDHPAVISILLQDPLTEDQPDEYGLTALHVAAKLGKVDCVKAFLRNGLDHTPISKHIGTPLHLAVRNNHPEVISILHKLPLVEELTDQHGLTALHVAAQLGNIDCVKALLSHGLICNQLICNQKNKNGTPLHEAVRNNHPEVISILLEDPLIEDQPDQVGFTALHVAAQLGKVNCVKAFVSHGLNHNHLSKDPETPLHLAVRNNHPEVISLLMEDPHLRRFICSCQK